MLSVSLSAGVVTSTDTGSDTIVRASIVGGVIFSTIENVTGGSGNDSIVGDGSGNLLVGGAGNDVLDGRQSGDTMIGGTGSDRYIVDNADDLVIEKVGEGSDTILATANYTLVAGSEIEVLQVSGTAGLALTGNEFAQTLIGSTGNDTLSGGLGNDVLDGRGGLDMLFGGGGNDRYTVDNAGDLVIERPGEGSDTILATASYTLVAGSEVEVLQVSGTAGLALTGNEFAQSLIGGVGADTLSGGAGDDVLDGRSGADRAAGGLGNDIYIVDNSNDLVIEDASEGQDQVNSSVSYTLTAHVENLTLTGAAHINGRAMIWPTS